jgi:nucleoside-diphosphate-sugar epimerase
MINNLVIGSSGFLGKRLCEFLREKNQNVIEFDIKNGENFDARYQNLPLDNIDRVYFLAWDVGGSKYLYNSSTQITQMEWNTQLMNNVFPQLKEIPFVFISSQLSEKIDTVYGVQKRMGEVWTKLCQHGVSVRLWNLYGYIEEFNEKSHVISDFVFQAKKNGVIEMLTDGKEERQFIHIDDVCEALLKSFDIKDKRQTYDITTTKWVSIYDVAKIIQKHTNCEIKIGAVVGETVLIDNKTMVPNWSPKISIEDGLKNMIEKNNEVLNIIQNG